MLQLKSQALFLLLEGLIDYAGLFPPAGLSMAEALDNYRSYQDSPYRFMLGRFVAPAARLAELADLLGPADVFSISALVDSADLSAVEAFNRRGNVKVDCLEWKFQAGQEWPRWPYLLFVEGAPAGPQHYARKLRTGGLQASAFPSLDAVRDFLEEAYAADSPFKFTAGLHHVLPGRYPVSYQPGCEEAAMHGFLQLFLAAAGLYSRRQWVDPQEIRWTSEQVEFSGLTLTAGEIKQFRERAGKSFGSCSFQEPVDELRGLGWI